MMHTAAACAFGAIAFCMLGVGDAGTPLRCDEKQFVCGMSEDNRICCPIKTWCCQYRNSPQFYCSNVRECEYGY
jgi:hypothetical protein